MSAPYGQDSQVVCPGPYTYQPLGCAQIAVTSTASTFKTLLTTAAAASPATSSFSDVPTGARLAVMTVDAANVRWSDDPSLAISTTVGLLMVFSTTVPAEYRYSGDLAAIKFILASGSPLINVASPAAVDGRPALSRVRGYPGTFGSWFIALVAARGQEAEPQILVGPN